MKDPIASQSGLAQEEISIKDQLVKFTVHWKWFVLSVFLALLSAFLYLRYAIPVHSSQAVIHVQDDQKGGALSESNALESLGIYSGFSVNNIDNELEVLKSRKLTSQVVSELGLSLEYYSVGKVITTETYEDSKIRIRFLESKGVPDVTSYQTFTIIPKTELSYRLLYGDDEQGKLHNYGEAVDLGFGEFMVVPAYDSAAASLLKDDNNLIIVRIYPHDAMIERYQRSISVKEKNKSSSVVQLTLHHPLKQKARDILNNLIKQYNKDAVADRNIIAEHTAAFIAERLAIISKELDSVETTKQTFKLNNKLTDINSEAQIFIENESEFQKLQSEVGTQLALTNNMLEVIKKDAGAKNPLPSNIGIADKGLEMLTSKYNQLILERNRILKSSTELNPIVVTINDQLKQLHGNIAQSLGSLKTSLDIKKNSLGGQQSRINSKIASVPQKEKEFRDIERQQTIKEALYLFLLQKREETSISLTVTAPVAKIIDQAYTLPGVVSPNRKMIFMAALLLGLLIPFGIIYLLLLLDTKIHNSIDIERITKDIPIIGELPKFDSKEKNAVIKSDRSILAESFRILRTNLNYLIKTRGGAKHNKVIYITSSVLGEGKTFVSFNLASTLATKDKKVILVGADIRNPQLQRYTKHSKNQMGLCEYLYEDAVTADRLIHRLQEVDGHVDLILSGRIPPNPAELFLSERLPQLLAQLRERYDYVLVDTAPTMLVTDTLLISQYADLTLYIARAGYSDRKSIHFPKELVKDGKLKNMAFVVNNVAHSKFGYSSKYEYAYGASEKNSVQRIWYKIKRLFK